MAALNGLRNAISMIFFSSFPRFLWVVCVCVCLFVVNWHSLSVRVECLYHCLMIARRIWAEKRSYQWIWIDVNQQAIEAFELTLIAAAVFVSGLNHTHSSSNAHSYCGCFVVSRGDF